jgi:hypothetical protein
LNVPPRGVSLSVWGGFEIKRKSLIDTTI